MDDQFINFIVIETNRYATVDNNDHSFSTSREEIRTFLAILLLTGYHTFPKQGMYWSTSPNSSIELVRSAMPRDQFRMIKKYIHFCSNSQVRSGDKYFKVRALCELAISKFMQWGLCEQNIAVDETIVPYYGRSLLKQLIRNKPVRFGFKNWCLAGQSGYCYHAYLYVGKEENQNSNIPLGTRVVDLFYI